jgi:alkylhydroperoxidase family enzyme
MGFSDPDLPGAVRDNLLQAQRAAWEALAGPGSWWSGAERVALARQLRAARSMRGKPPRLRGDPAADSLPAAARAAVWRIALDPHQLDRDWYRETAAALGEERYVELVSVVVSMTAIDVFAEALGTGLEPLPEPRPGEPSRQRPAGVGEEGAWVPMASDWRGPNVGRALSLVPNGNQMFMSLVFTMYAGSQFAELVWKDRPLSRPQVELVAARVSALNECFY